MLTEMLLKFSMNVVGINLKFEHLRFAQRIVARIELLVEFIYENFRWHATVEHFVVRRREFEWLVIRHSRHATERKLRYDEQFAGVNQTLALVDRHGCDNEAKRFVANALGSSSLRRNAPSASLSATRSSSLMTQLSSASR